MRGGTNWRSIIAAPEGHWAFWFLELQALDATWINLSDLAITDRTVEFPNSYDLEDDIDRNTPTFSATLRGSVGAFSLMPFRTDSPLNASGGTYQPLVDLHIPWRLWVCFTPRNTFPEGPGDYRERARGIVDRIDLSMSRDEIRLQGRGPEADLIDHLIIADEVTPKVYAAGPVADVLQAMLDDQFPGTYTLVVDGSAPSTFIDEITYTEPVGFWKLFSDTAAVGTGVVRFLYDDSDNLDIHLFTPNRSATVPQWSVGPDEYGDIDNGLDLQTVTNYIVVRFVNASGVIQTVTSPATPVSASITRYGQKSTVITLAQNSGVNDATRAQLLADAIRSDRELPILGQVVTGSGLWFGELWDYVGTPANPVLYNEDQAGGVVGYHESGRNSVIDNVFTLQGKPKGRYATWLEISGVLPTPTDLAPGVTSSSATFKESVFLFVTVTAVEFVCTLNDRTQSVEVALYSDSALTALVDYETYNATSAAPLTGGLFGMSGPLVRDVVYYVKITPYSGPLDMSAVPTGTAGPYALPNTNVLPEPTDTPTVSWDRSDPALLKANVIGGAGVEVGTLVGSLAIPTLLFQTLEDDQWLALSTIPTAETEVGTEYRTQSYAVGAGSVRVGANIKAKTGTPTIGANYSLDGFSTKPSLISFTPAGTGVQYSGWGAMPSPAKADIGVTWSVGAGADTAALDLYRVWIEYLPAIVTGARVHVAAFAAAFN